MLGLSNTINNSLPRSEDQAARRPYAVRLAFCGLCAVLAVSGIFTSNGLLTSAAIAELPLLAYLLWREGEPPVLLFGCFLQWIQATAAIFYTNHYGMTLEEAFGGNELTIATWLSIGAVITLAVGVRCAFIGSGPSRGQQLEKDAFAVNINKIAVLYGVSFIVCGILGTVAWQLPSITQPLLAIASLKWAVVFLLSYAVLHQRRNYGVLIACMALEFATGLFGVFSGFKNVFLVFMIAALASRLALHGRRLAAISSCVVILLIMGVVWSAIKMDYRTFLADEETSSEESIPIERKFSKLADLVESVTWQNFEDGMEAMVLRLSYVHYFALAINNVPSHVPYENGALWAGSVMHVLTPRLLFPDKPALDDSERTRLYTGVQVSGTESGTSIGIGYVGESYIDFGPVWMFVPIFLLGLIYGVINRVFVNRTRYKLIGSALAVSVLIFNAYAIETSNIKLVGGVVAAALVAGVLYKLLGATIANFLRQSPVREPGVRQFAAVSRSAR